MGLSLKNLDRICLAFVILVSFLCGYFVVSSAADQRRKNREKNEVLEKRLNDLKLAETNLERAKTILEGSQAELKALNERIPEAGKFGAFLNQLDLLIKGKGLALHSVQPRPSVKEGHFKRIPISLVFKGPFEKIYQLVHDLETLPRAVVVGRMIISKTDRAKGCRVNLTASVLER